MKKRIIAFFSLAFLCFSSHSCLSAQDAFIIIDMNPVVAGISKQSSPVIVLRSEWINNSHALYYEAEIELEVWMLEHFSNQEVPVLASTEEQEIILENWMINPIPDRNRFYEKCIRVQEEKPVELEDWMLHSF